MSIDLFLGVLSFTGVVLLLVCIIIFARSLLVSTGSVNIEINDDPTNTITVPAGSKLLQTLAENKIFLSFLICVLNEQLSSCQMNMINLL